MTLEVYHRSIWRALSLVALLIAAPVAAQRGAWGVTPVVGYYRPFGDFAPASVHSTALPRQPDELRGLSWGAMAQLSLPRRLGVLAELVVTNSRVPAVITPAGPRGPKSAHVTIGSVQGQYDASLDRHAYHLWINAGPAIVHHGGDAYASLAATSAPAAAAGATLAIPLRAHLQFAAAGTLLLYHMDIPMPPELRLNPGSLERGTQRDALLQVGLTWGSY